MSAEYERWLGLNLAAMRDFFTRIGRNAAEGKVIERDGLIAVVNPATPKSSLFNSVIYEDPAAVQRELAALAGTHEQAGVLAWTVWVPSHDSETAKLLEQAGHKLDTSPRLMGRELSGLEPHSMDGIEWSAEGSPEDVACLNDLAYGLPAGVFERGCGLMARDQFGVYVAEHEGEPAACVATTDLGSDLGIWAVATLPEARGRGLSTALMRQALADAGERGLKTTTLQASVLGRPVYDRLGYGDFGHFEMWERREE